MMIQKSGQAVEVDVVGSVLAAGVVAEAEAVLEGAEVIAGVVSVGAVAEAEVVAAVGAVVEPGQEPVTVVKIHGRGNLHVLLRIHLPTYSLLEQCLVQVG